MSCFVPPMVIDVVLAVLSFGNSCIANEVSIIQFEIRTTLTWFELVSTFMIL
jgi:hypothetical protein